MNIVLWILQVLLAVMFLWHGWLFVAPPADLVETMNAAYPPALRIFIGVAEWLAGAGLILPGMTRILPWLTALAAAGLMLVVGSATVFHLTRGEISSALTTAVIFVLLTFVAYMRWKVKPIAPRETAQASHSPTRSVG
jgi:uncharacterized membrane protein YphA (DoxX/SURF4 family)